MGSETQLQGLVGVVRTELIALTLALIAVVAFRCLTGRIRLNGLLNAEDGRISATRVQLLMTTFTVALMYLLSPTEFSLSGQIGAGVAVGGSNLLYLVKKYRLLSG